MILQFMIRDARPTGGIWTITDVVKRSSTESFKRPILIRAAGNENAVRQFDKVADKLPWGSVICFSDLDGTTPVALNLVNSTIERTEWRRWQPAGAELGEVIYVRAHGDFGYGTHQRYLVEAACLSEGLVLELGSGDSSTPMLHEKCKRIITIDNNLEWLNRYLSMTSVTHEFIHRTDPAKFLEERDDHFGLAFVDHAPGETRKDAVLKLRNRADYIVVHDTEDNGYQIWEILESFKYRRHFRYMRPWTSIVSMTHKIFDDPYGQE